MSSEDYLYNLIEKIVEEVLSRKTWTSLGSVSAFDEATYTAKVHLHYEQVETSFMRISVGYAGNNFGEKTPIHIGDEVVVSFYNGDPTSGIITGRIYTIPDNPPPVSYVPAGAWGIKHESGSSLLMSLDGSITATDPTGKRFVLTNNKFYTNTGSAGADQAVVLKAFLDFFNLHMHIGNLGVPTTAPMQLTTDPGIHNLASDGS